jgi:CHAT domain-containing protein
VFLLVLTAETLNSFEIPLTSRLRQAIEACQQGPLNPSESDLAILGESLIPAEVLAQMSPEDYLLIAPHRDLHGLPWSSLGKNPLVERCIPCLVPSLHALSLLCEKAGREEKNEIAEEKNGLLIGISEFHGSHPDLPYVKQEMEVLKPRVGNSGRVLVEEDASFAILAQLGQVEGTVGIDRGLKHYDWMHMASHFFSDPASGYLSGVALSEGSIWLDQIHDLAPLPDLVTFSGCSAIFSRVYDGDEHIGLPSTCLISGSQTIVGSIWPVADESSAQMMTKFYDHYLQGNRPAVALALAQREIHQANSGLPAWAGFSCVGLP